MPNVCMAAGVRLAVLTSVVCLGGAPAWGQLHTGIRTMLAEPSAVWVPRLECAGIAGSRVEFSASRDRRVSRGRPPFRPMCCGIRSLQKHGGCLRRRCILRNWEIITRRSQICAMPWRSVQADAAYAHNLLGLEYIEVQQYAEAKTSFAEAARLMPHESSNHSNLGLSLAIIGEWDSAEQEERKALQLDKSNDKAKEILEALLVRKRTQAA